MTAYLTTLRQYEAAPVDTVVAAQRPSLYVAQPFAAAPYSKTGADAWQNPSFPGVTFSSVDLASEPGLADGRRRILHYGHRAA